MKGKPQKKNKHFPDLFFLAFCFGKKEGKLPKRQGFFLTRRTPKVLQKGRKTLKKANNFLAKERENKEFKKTRKGISGFGGDFKIRALGIYVFSTFRYNVSVQCFSCWLFSGLEKLTRSSLKGVYNMAPFAYRNGRFASSLLLLGIGL